MMKALTYLRKADAVPAVAGRRFSLGMSGVMAEGSASLCRAPRRACRTRRMYWRECEGRRMCDRTRSDGRFWCTREPDGARGGEHVYGAAQPAKVAAVLRPDEGGEPQHRGEVRRTEVRRRGREPVREAGEHGGLAWGDPSFPWTRHSGGEFLHTTKQIRDTPPHLRGAMRRGGPRSEHQARLRPATPRENPDQYEPDTTPARCPRVIRRAESGSRPAIGSETMRFGPFRRYGPRGQVTSTGCSTRERDDRGEGRVQPLAQRRRGVVLQRDEWPRNGPSHRR